MPPRALKCGRVKVGIERWPRLRSSVGSELARTRGARWHCRRSHTKGRQRLERVGVTSPIRTPRWVRFVSRTPVMAVVLVPRTGSWASTVSTDPGHAASPAMGRRGQASTRRPLGGIHEASRSDHGPRSGAHGPRSGAGEGRCPGIQGVHGPGSWAHGPGSWGRTGSWAHGPGSWARGGRGHGRWPGGAVDGGGEAWVGRS